MFKNTSNIQPRRHTNDELTLSIYLRLTFDKKSFIPIQDAENFHCIQSINFPSNEIQHFKFLLQKRRICFIELCSPIECKTGGAKTV